MYQKIRNLLLYAVIPAVLSAFLFSFPVFAEDAFCTVSIPVEVTVSGTGVPSGMEYEVLLERVTENAPMPEASSLMIRDGGKSAFGPVTYTMPGDYQYRVFQKPRQEKNFTFDESVYLVTVRVVNGQGGGLTAVITAEKNSGSEKPENIRFENKYTRPPSSYDDDDDDDDDDTDRPSRVITDDGKPGPGNETAAEAAGPENHDVITMDIPEIIPSLTVIPRLGDMGVMRALGGMAGALALLFLSLLLYRKSGREQ